MTEDELRATIMSGLENLVEKHIGVHEDGTADYADAADAADDAADAADERYAKSKAKKDADAAAATAKKDADDEARAKAEKWLNVEPGYVVIRTTDVTHTKGKTADGESTVNTSIDDLTDTKNPRDIRIGPIIEDTKLSN
jgi:membrane protein involved in colicin uptake